MGGGLHISDSETITSTTHRENSIGFVYNQGQILQFFFQFDLRTINEDAHARAKAKEIYLRTYLNSDFRRFCGVEIAVIIVDPIGGICSLWMVLIDVIDFVFILLCRTIIKRDEDNASILQNTQTKLMFSSSSSSMDEFIIFFNYFYRSSWQDEKKKKKKKKRTTEYSRDQGEMNERHEK